MRRKLKHQLGVYRFAVEALLQHVERLHAAIAHDQELAVDRAGKPQRVDEVGEAFGDVLAGARIEPRDDRAVAPRRGGLHADAVPFPFGHELGRIERGKIGVLERVRQHRRAKRRRIGAFRFFGASLSSATASWQQSLMARFASLQRYPPKAHGAQGVVSLAFTIDRHGNVTSSRIVKSSGSALLDAEALDLIKRAAPLPAPPPQVSDADLTFVLPVRFAADEKR